MTDMKPSQAPGSYSPIDAPHMRDEKGRPLEWLNCILCHRDRIEMVIRCIHGGPELCGYTTRQLMALDAGDYLPRRAHKHLITWIGKNQWMDPIC